MKEKEKLLNGNWCDSRDLELVNERNRAWLLIQEYAKLPPESKEAFQFLKRLLGAIGNRTIIRPSFYIDLLLIMIFINQKKGISSKESTLL